MANTKSGGGDSSSVPRRARWGRRIVFSLLALLLVLVVVHGIWTHLETSDVARRAAWIRAAGEPMTVEDLTSLAAKQAAPDELNAAIDLRRAALWLGGIGRFWSDWAGDAVLGIPLTADEAATLAKLEAGCVPFFADVRTATTKPAVDWQIAYKSPLAFISLPDLNDQRGIAAFLRQAALGAHHRGDHRLALGRASEILFVARALDRQPLVISHLVALGMSRMAAGLVVELAPDLRIGPVTGDVPPAAARALIAALIDDGPWTQGLRWSLQTERVLVHDAAVYVLAGNPLNPAANSAGDQIERGLLKPLYARDARVLIDHLTAALGAADAPDWPAASARLPQWTSGDFHPLKLGFSCRQPIMIHFRAVAERRLAATALAIRLYAIDHNGARPAKLADLVPAYLPSLPLDPFAAGGKPLSYVTAPAHAIYSFGEDGTDNGGNPAPRSARVAPGVEVDPWQCLDTVIPLDRPAREPKATPADFDAER